MAVRGNYFVATVQKPQTTFDMNRKGKIKRKGIIKSTKRCCSLLAELLYFFTVPTSIETVSPIWTMIIVC